MEMQCVFCELGSELYYILPHETFFLLKYSDRFWNPFCSAFLSTGLKRPGRQADLLHPSSTDIENEWSYTSAVTLTPRKRVLLKKQVLPHQVKKFPLLYRILRFISMSKKGSALHTLSQKNPIHASFPYLLSPYIP